MAALPHDNPLPSAAVAAPVGSLRGRDAVCRPLAAGSLLVTWRAAWERRELGPSAVGMRLPPPLPSFLWAALRLGGGGGGRAGIGHGCAGPGNCGAGELRGRGIAGLNAARAVLDWEDSQAQARAVSNV